MSGRADEYVEVLKEINLTINQGDFVSFIGRSGCGKTTLLKIMGLLTTPSEGEIIINGVQVKELWKDESCPRLWLINRWTTMEHPVADLWISDKIHAVFFQCDMPEKKKLSRVIHKKGRIHPRVFHTGQMRKRAV